MIEWIHSKPKDQEKRVIRKFAFVPKECHSNVWVWLEFYYVFQEYEKYDSSINPIIASFYVTTNSYDKWITVNSFSKSQYKVFQQNLALHLTDTNGRLRAFAEHVQKLLSSKKRGPF